VAASWICPNCRRRVPAYAGVCHCGTRRADAELVAEATHQAQPRSDRWAPIRIIPASVWVLIGVMVLTVVGMVVRLLQPYETPRYLIMVGQVDRMPQPQGKR
jgi:hypothetical protein